MSVRVRRHRSSAYHGRWEASVSLSGGVVLRVYRRTAVGALVGLLATAWRQR